MVTNHRNLLDASIARFDDRDIGENTGRYAERQTMTSRVKSSVFLPCAILTLLAASSRQDTMAGDQERDIGSASSALASATDSRNHRASDVQHSRSRPHPDGDAGVSRRQPVE